MKGKGRVCRKDRVGRKDILKLILPTAEQEGRAIYSSDYHLIQILESCEVTFASKGNE